MSLSKRSQINSLYPYMRDVIQYLLRVADHYQSPYSILSVNRTAREQFDLYMTNSRAVRPGCSQHQYFAAADVQFQDPAWQNWYTASARAFGLSTVSGDPAHVQLIPGAQFRAWAGPRGLCPDPNYPNREFAQSELYLRCGVGSSGFIRTLTGVICDPDRWDYLLEA